MTNLEKRVAALEAEVAALKAPKAPPALKVVDEGVRVLIGRQAINVPQLNLPTEEEYASLRAIVGKHYPHLNFKAHNPRWASDDAAEDAESFKSAFAYLCTLERLETLPRADRYASWWQSEAVEWARTMGLRSANGPLNSFLAAIGAHGDISFSELSNYATLGLRQGDRGRRYSEKWRDVLRTGEILKPVKSAELARA